jgi:hypothetical protein
MHQLTGVLDAQHDAGRSFLLETVVEPVRHQRTQPLNVQVPHVCGLRTPPEEVHRHAEHRSARADL